LALAGELGADVTVDVEHDDLDERVREHTSGRGVDIVIDTTPHAAQPVRDAVRIVRLGGTIVLGGLKGHLVDGFPVDEVAMKALRVIGVRGVGAESYRTAIELLGSGRFPVERLRTHTFTLDQAEHAVRVLAGEVPGEQPINVVIAP
jgi:threonine dehydrogenase-like Zn-dependent dehydrogenase